MGSHRVGHDSDNMASVVTQTVKSLPAMQKTWVQSLGQEDPWGRE